MAKFVGLFISFIIGVVFSELFLVTDWHERIGTIPPLALRIGRDRAVLDPPAAKPSRTGPVGADGNGPAWQHLAAGRLKEAQDAFLGILVFNPSDASAMRGLIAARRRLAGNDPAVLRGQAERYRKAIAVGTDTEEHYSARSMEVLASASLNAAKQIEAEQPKRADVTPPNVAEMPPPQRLAQTAAEATPAPAPAQSARPRQPETPRTAPRTAGARGQGADPQRPAKTRATQRRTPVEQPQPPLANEPPVPPAPPPEPALDETEPFSLISVGPIRRRDRASEIVGHLTLAGYTARMSREDGSRSYRITLGPYRRSAVQVITQLIQSRFGSVPIAVRAVP